ncbi:helix-hairpin-helix domain-containing protein [Desemzia sp. RIT804]|uniref:helix-hairpin-helix domain-containing protein n=1 Tax=Desemzia sp. RIT 804 TaxID=2810209 RepID=UPI001951E85A|nr:helix-hairpin-helix domain-containing protein [Desemzia sp. RIT 804]MBM6613621.1 helix-hairpin-helix domain-containing protein [Desemzia sp. RIT 804]
MLQKLKEKMTNIPLLIGITSGVVGLIFLVVSLLLFINFKEGAQSENELGETTENYLMEITKEGGSAGSGETESLATTEQNLYVDVKGAVHSPGVYQVTSDMRLMDAVELAGGLLISADQSQINLALKLTDQMVVYVPQIGEEVKEISDENSLIRNKSAEQEGKINLNTADTVQLQTLNGIGEKKAEKIIQYREENGSFQSTDELKNVSGIGDKTFEALKDFVVVDSQ